METATTQLDMIHECLGGDVGVDGLSLPAPVDPCVFDGVDNEGAIAVFGGFVKIKIVPKQFVDGLGAGADNVSGIIGDDQVDDGPFGRCEHLVVLRFVGSVRRYD